MKTAVFTHRRSMPMRRNQSGAVLIVCLVMLTVLTLIAVTAMNSGSLQSQMAGNEMAHQRAFSMAEIGLNAAFINPDSFARTDQTVNTTVALNGYTVSTNASFLQFTTPGRKSGGQISGQGVSHAHFLLAANAFAGNNPATSNTENRLSGGAYKPIPRDSGQAP